MLNYRHMNDISRMKRVLFLASKARGMTSPNPMVGAILVKNNTVLAEAYHRKAGMPHAEALVISAAGEKAGGALLYVNLEPCCHTDKKTPPCTKAIIEAGIKKVFIGMQDPNPKVAGKGTAELHNAGIETVTGICEADAKKLNEAYIKYITTRVPFVILKTAMTIDGKIATPEGQSKWITSELSRRMVHRLRSSVDAVITAIGTVRADNPQLTARTRPQRNTPKRIIIDPGLAISPDARILQTPPETFLVIQKNSCQSAAVAEKKSLLLGRGTRFLEYEDSLHLGWLLKRLGEMEITSVLLEGGSSLNSHALEDNIVDKVMFFIAPKIIGGSDSFTAVGGKSFRRLEDAHRLKDIKVRKIGSDILVEGYIDRISANS